MDLMGLISTHWRRLFHYCKFMCSISSKANVVSLNSQITILKKWKISKLNPDFFLFSIAWFFSWRLTSGNWREMVLKESFENNCFFVLFFWYCTILYRNTGVHFLSFSGTIIRRKLNTFHNFPWDIPIANFFYAVRR